MKLRLAVDARVVATDIRGIGRYARAILRRLAPRDDVALTLLIPEFLPGRRRKALARALGTNRFSVARRVPRNTNVTWFPANGTFFESRAPIVATIHDAVPFRYPNADPKKRDREQLPFLETAKVAHAFIAVSEFGKNEICSAFRIPPDRVTAIHHGIDEAFSPGETGALPADLSHGGYVLFVGDPAEPRKNFAMLLRAHRAAWPNGDGPVLAIAGVDAPPAAGVVALGRLGGDLEHDGTDDLRSLYRGALAVVVPSYHETFGFPLLEAMACGTPAIASDVSSLPEVGGDAAHYAAAHDHTAWSSVLSNLHGDASLRAQMSERGLARAAAFTWDASALAHLELFRRVAEGG